MQGWRRSLSIIVRDLARDRRGASPTTRGRALGVGARGGGRPSGRALAVVVGDERRPLLVAHLVEQDVRREDGAEPLHVLGVDRLGLLHVEAGRVGVDVADVELLDHLLEREDVAVGLNLPEGLVTDSQYAYFKQLDALYRVPLCGGTPEQLSPVVPAHDAQATAIFHVDDKYVYFAAGAGFGQSTLVRVAK